MTAVRKKVRRIARVEVEFIVTVVV